MTEEGGEEIYGDRSTFMSVTAFLLMGLLLIWAGLNYLNGFWHFMTVDADTYQITKVILSLFVLLFAVYSFSKGLVTEGIVVMFTGLSSTVFAFGSMFFGVAGLNRMDALFSIGILLASLLFYGRNRFVAVASLLLGLTMAVPFLLGYRGESLLMGMGLLLSGILFMYYALGNLLFGETGRNLLRVSQNDRCLNFADDRERAYVLAIVPGLFTFALLQVLVGLQFVMVTDLSLSYCVAEALMSAAVIFFAVYGLSRGVVAESMMMLIFAVSCFVFSIVALSGAVPSTVIDGLMSVVLLVAGLVFMYRHDRVLGAGALIFALGGFLEALFHIYVPAGYLIIAAGLLSLYYSIDRWVVLETGYRLLSFRWLKVCLRRQ